MLILNREKYQSVVIGEEITVTVLRIRCDKVWLGIVFPKNVPAHRQETYDAIQGRSAVSPATAAFAFTPTLKYRPRMPCEPQVG